MRITLAEQRHQYIGGCARPRPVTSFSNPIIHVAIEMAHRKWPCRRRLKYFRHEPFAPLALALEVRRWMAAAASTLASSASSVPMGALKAAATVW
jgi:hypothetical protein